MITKQLVEKKLNVNELLDMFQEMKSIAIMAILPAAETGWARESRIKQVNILIEKGCAERGFLYLCLKMSVGKMIPVTRNQIFSFMAFISATPG